MNTWIFMKAFIHTRRDEKKESRNPIKHICGLKAMGVQKGKGLTSHEHDNMIVRNDQELIFELYFPARITV